MQEKTKKKEYDNKIKHYITTNLKFKTVKNLN